MKVVFMGTPDFSVPTLKALHEAYPIRLVVTQPDRPSGRRRQLTPPPVKTCAQALGLPVFQPVKVRKDYQAILDTNPDIIVTAAYGQIIPKALLETPPYGAINVHGSLLPELRGGAPIQRAIERQYTQTGITIMAMNEAMDAGDIIAQKACLIDSRETTGSLFKKLSIIGRDLLIETLPDIFANKASYVPQVEADATYAYNLKKEEEQLDFNLSARDLDAKIRAFYPTPNTFVQTTEGARLKVLTANLSQADAEKYQAGEIVAIDKQGIHVATSEGALCIMTVQPAGKKPMSAQAYAHGAGRHLMQRGQWFTKL